MPVWHLTIAADGRQTLFPSDGQRHAGVRVLARLAGTELVLFSLVDDHAHLVVLGERERAGRLARAVLLGLRPLAAAPLDPARVRPVESRAHLESLVRYVLRQTARHGLPEHPALWSGSCFQDLVGARWLPGLQLRLAEALPRLGPAALCAAAGLDPAPLAPASDEALRGAGVARLVAAVAAAHALPLPLTGRTTAVVVARAAIAHLALGCGLAAADVAWALHLTPRGVRELLERQPPAELLRAARTRHALVERLAGPAGPPPLA